MGLLSQAKFPFVAEWERRYHVIRTRPPLISTHESQRTMRDFP